ncbi:unnamed protein product [Ectocarpus sp. 4 AP-2014]
MAEGRQSLSLRYRFGRTSSQEAAPGWWRSRACILQMCVAMTLVDVIQPDVCCVYSRWQQEGHRSTSSCRQFMFRVLQKCPAMALAVSLGIFALKRLRLRLALLLAGKSHEARGEEPYCTAVHGVLHVTQRGDAYNTIGRHVITRAFRTPWTFHRPTRNFVTNRSIGQEKSPPVLACRYAFTNEKYQKKKKSVCMLLG